MSSMILSTSPRRRILQASPEMETKLGCPARQMVGLDCASVLRCRNADGKPLCREFCPVLMASRRRAGEAVEVPVWLEDAGGCLERHDATFQRVVGLPNGMVVAFFGDPPATGEKPAAWRVIVGEGPAMLRGEDRRSGEVARPTLRPLGS